MLERRFRWGVLCALTVLAGCGSLPGSGPNDRQLSGLTAPDAPAAAALVQVVDVDDAVARRLLSQRAQPLFSESMTQAQDPGVRVVAPGDALEVIIWEAPPAALFSPGSYDPRQPSGAGMTTLPEQLVDRDGQIVVPFAGRVPAAGQTLRAIGDEIARRLKGKANNPEVLVRLGRSSTGTVTVVGEVSSSLRMPLTPAGERLLDALAAAGGVKQAVNRVTVQVTRGDRYQSLPLDQVIRDPKQNIRLQAGDVVTALYQPLSFTALGATGRNEEVNFEAQGITLAQALARVGGLVDNKSDPQGVFIFRFERQGALDWPRQPAATTPDGLVPVVYRIDLRNPASFFVMQGFPMQHRDVLYVSNAPVAELQKFLNVVFSITFPLINTVNALD